MYKSCLKVLTRHFGDYTLDRITPQMMEKFKAERLSQHRQRTDRLITKATVNREIATIKRLFSLAEEWGYVRYNHLGKVKLLSEKGSERTRFLTEDESGKLLIECAASSEWLRMAVLIALETGFRKTPIYTLEWKDISFTDRHIEKETKGDKKVKVPMTGTLYNELLAWKKSQTIMSRWVFPSPEDPSRHVSIATHNNFDRACRRAKIFDFRFHDLRHTFASHFLMRTKDIKTLQEILGHSDIKMTMRYSHVLDEHKRKAMEIFEKGAAL
jgi:integrase